MTRDTGVPVNRRAAGKIGEDAALKYLVERGYLILYRNFRFGRYGEVDLIAKDSDTVCFIEVKSRANDAFGTPAEAVGAVKRRSILAVAGHFMKISGLRENAMRFDVIEVYYDRTADRRAPRPIREIRHIKDAFGEN